ncbi:MAG TPA: Tex family protein [Anaerolineaceae bacterium]
MTHAQIIAKQLNVQAAQVSATIELLDSGNTLPFIARYRKEATGTLDEEQLRQIIEQLEKLRTVDERRDAILKSIEEQGKLTTQLQQQLQAANSVTALEDLYLPYKPKRRTRASIAHDKGLGGLAEWILKQPPTKQTLAQIARPFLNDLTPTEEEAWAGARDIVAEAISEHAEVRHATRERAMHWGTIHVEKIEDAVDERGVYQTYYAFECGVDRLRPHQVLAINRGEKEKVVRVRVEIPERDWLTAILTVFQPQRISPLAGQLDLAIADAAERLLLPAIERDVRRDLSEKAELHAINVFAANLRSLLSQPPLAGQTVLGIDPGFRTGSKVAAVDPTGKVLETGTIYPHQPQKEREKSLKTLAALAKKHHVTLITIGNGTASRETEQLAADLIHTYTPEVKYLIVNEAGASVYSASPLARAELPGLDVSLRGAVSIARRAQDPLAELVKIDPKSIGVGLYQHDVDQKRLTESLTGVVESVVNQVGVDVSTASPALLTYVAGIGPKLAEKIVEYRDQNGPFLNRAALRKVSGVGPKAFEQAAGFLRIRDGENPLDDSAIHPESYPAAEAVLKKAGLTSHTPPAERRPALDELLKRQSIEKLTVELRADVPTLSDIFEQLVRPGRDPRQNTPPPILRSDILSMDDLVPGMRLKGTVRNVVDFGTFIDIGVKQDGLLHRSQIPPGTRLNAGDIIEVEIQKIENERGRIALAWPGG